MANGDVVKLNLITEASGVSMANTFYLKDTDSAEGPGDTLTDALDVGENTIVAQDLVTVTSDELAFTCLSASFVVGPTLPPLTRFISDAGNVVGDMHPTTQCVVLAYYGDNYGLMERRFNWRFAGIPESHSENGRLSEAALALWNTVANNWQTGAGFSDGNISWVLQGRWVDPVGPTTNYASAVSVRPRAILRKFRGRQTRLCGT